MKGWKACAPPVVVNADSSFVDDRQAREFKVASSIPGARFLHVEMDEFLLLDKRGHVVEECAWSDVWDVGVERVRVSAVTRLWVAVHGNKGAWLFVRPWSLRPNDSAVVDLARGLRPFIPASGRLGFDGNGNGDAGSHPGGL